MSKNQKAYITFGAQMGDVRADATVASHLISLRKLLDKYCKGPYSPEVDEFAPIARVDGDLWYWEFEGCQKLRWSRKCRYITVDIGVPRSRWENVSPHEMRLYLINNLKHALTLMVSKLKKEKASVNDALLFEDVARVEEEYLNEVTA